MIWLCAGVYAEGPTDDRFLCNLINDALRRLAASQQFDGELRKAIAAIAG